MRASSVFRSSLLQRALLPLRASARGLLWQRHFTSPAESLAAGAKPGALKLNDLRLAPACIEALSRTGVTELMPIQEATLQHLRNGQDIIARAKTGSGKTLAFLLPMLEKLTDKTTKRVPGKAAAIIIGECRWRADWPV